MTALVKFENHFEDNTTLVFLHNGKHIIINGCQTFSTSNMESVFEEYDVPESIQNDVREAINSVNDEVTNEDFELILSISPMYLQSIASQTPELCLVAVQKDGWAIQLVKDQTPELCMAAVKNNGCALQYVKEQTPEICMAAMKNQIDAIEFVKDKSMVAHIA